MLHFAKYLCMQYISYTPSLYLYFDDRLSEFASQFRQFQLFTHFFISLIIFARSANVAWAGSHRNEISSLARDVNAITLHICLLFYEYIEGFRRFVVSATQHSKGTKE